MPERNLEDWWSDYRKLFGAIALVSGRHTSSATRTWFAVWEGHGFTGFSTRFAWMGPLEDATRVALDQHRARLQEEDARRIAAIRSGLRDIPRFELPHRTYYLLGGSVTAVTELKDPPQPGRWHHCDLIWPDDRRWFVATDVDFWSLYVGGDDDFISELAEDVPTRTEIVALDQGLEIED